MCGRFTLFSDLALLEQLFGFAGGYQLQPRYNIAPTQPVLAVRVREDGNREGVPLLPPGGQRPRPSRVAFAPHT